MKQSFEKAEARKVIEANLESIVSRINQYLEGKRLKEIDDIVNRLGRGGSTPHWFNDLEINGSLPNADGKTVGSIIELLFCADIERNLFENTSFAPLKINPASGVDIPGIGLGIKSPSENWCTSEPFTSSYERVLGSEYDVVCLITDYQTAKKQSPLKLQIIRSAFFYSTEIADKNICLKAKCLRDNLENLGEQNLKKGLRFLAHVNQSHWLGKCLAELFMNLGSQKDTVAVIKRQISEGSKKVKKGGKNLTIEDVENLASVLNKTPINEAIINLSDSWVNQHSPDFATIPNNYYWQKFLESPLNGKLGVSFALQWRYNFGIYFNE